jgi:hypothetical protein
MNDRYLSNQKNCFYFFLRQHHANIHQLDHEGRTCLTFAKAANLEATLEAKEITISLVEFLTNLGCTDASENSILSNYRNSNHEL